MHCGLTSKATTISCSLPFGLIKPKSLQARYAVDEYFIEKLFNSTGHSILILSAYLCCCYAVLETKPNPIKIHTEVVFFSIHVVQLFHPQMYHPACFPGRFIHGSPNHLTTAATSLSLQMSDLPPIFFSRK